MSINFLQTVDEKYETWPSPLFTRFWICSARKVSYSANNSKISRKFPFCGEPINSLLSEIKINLQIKQNRPALTFIQKCLKLPRKANPLDDRNFITLKIRAETLHQYFLSDSFCSSKALQMLELFALREMYMEWHRKSFSEDSEMLVS